MKKITTNPLLFATLLSVAIVLVSTEGEVDGPKIDKSESSQVANNDQSGNHEEEQTTSVSNNIEHTSGDKSDLPLNQEDLKQSDPSASSSSGLENQVSVTSTESSQPELSPSSGNESITGSDHNVEKGNFNSGERPYDTNVPSFLDHRGDADQAGQKEIDSTRASSESSVSSLTPNVQDQLEVVSTPTPVSVSSDPVSHSTDAPLSLFPSSSKQPSMALEEQSVAPIHVTEIESYSNAGDTEVSMGSNHSIAESTEVSVSPQSPTDTLAEVPTDVSSTTEIVPRYGTEQQTSSESEEESANHSSENPKIPSSAHEVVVTSENSLQDNTPAPTILPVSNVMSKPLIKARKEIPETHRRDLVYLVIQYKKFDIFDWVDSKDALMRTFMARKLQEHLNHSFSSSDVLYIENSPKVELDVIFMEMGIIDHEYKHGLHLYPGDKVVQVLSSQNVTNEMADTISVEILVITLDKSRAENIFDTLYGGTPFLSTMVARGDMVLVILILTFVTCSIMILVLVGYCCCRRKGNNNKINPFGLNHLFNIRHNHSSTSSVQSPPTNTTSPQEFNLRTLERMPPLYNCYDLNPAAEILRDEKCSVVNGKGSNLSINVPVNGNSVTLLQHHYPQVQMNRRSSSHTGLHQIHVNEGWIQVLPRNSSFEENKNVVRKYSNQNSSNSSNTSTSSSNPDVRMDKCTCTENNVVPCKSLSVHIRHQTNLSNYNSPDVNSHQRNSNQRQMVSFISTNGIMKDTKL